MNDLRGSRRQRTTNIDQSRDKFSDPPTQTNARLFSLSFDGECALAPVSDVRASSATINRLAATMEKLNIAKSFQTQAYSRSRDLSFAIRSAMDMFSRFKRDVGRHQKHVTNAWLKGWEIMNQFGSATAVSGETIRVYHVAEFPGSTLLAVERFLDNMGVVDDWRASSYYQKSTIDVALKDDYHLYDEHADLWLMDGVKTFGDMTSPADIRYHIEYAAEHGRGRIFSSDLAVGGDNDYNHQEETNAIPHLGAAICALGMLEVDPRSLMFLKFFTLTTHLSVSLMQFLSSKFDSFHLMKPATSRPMNSEIYVVGVGFKGASSSEIEGLISWLEYLSTCSNPSTYSLCSINDTFLAAHVRAQKSLIGVQQMNLQYFERAYTIIRQRDSPEMTAFIELCNHSKFRVVTEWRAITRFDRAIGV